MMTLLLENKAICIKLICLIILIFGTSCNNRSEIIEEYWGTTKLPKRKKYYTNKNDTSNYVITEYYKGGGQSDMRVYNQGKLIKNLIWFENGNLLKYDSIIGEFNDTSYILSGSETVTVITKPTVGISKEFDKNGTIIFEKILLPNKRLVYIKRDSNGKLISSDTIIYH